MEATDVFDKLQIDAVILGLSLDPAEIDILDYHLKEKSNAKLIVMDKSKSHLSEIYKKLTSAVPIGLPVDPNQLLDLLSRELGFDYGGYIQGVNLASFLQMVELEAKTGVVKIISEDKIGEIFLDTGNLINAKTGKLKGKEAVLSILKWIKPLISITYQKPKIKKGIEETLMSILLESSHLSDDKTTGNNDLRRFKRFECSREVILHVDDLIYRGVIRDISMGGIFIETGMSISAGKEITLTIEDPESMKPDFIKGKIVRSNEFGVGVEFNSLKISQKNLLKTLIHDANLTEEV